MVNEYSGEWFRTFLDPIPVENTRGEVDGLSQFIPLPDFHRVLDVCCGPGRHIAELADRGYEVTGIDRDQTVVSQARQRVPIATILELDIRDLGMLDREFDAAVNLWASFGHFEADTNDEVLRQLHGLLRPKGRLLLDLFHPLGLKAKAGPAQADEGKGTRTLTEELPDNRWRVTIEYLSGNRDVFEWELFTPEQLPDRADKAGFDTLFTMTWWDPIRPPTPEELRYQGVFQAR